MFQEHQHQAENHHESNHDPYRHKGYKKVLRALYDALDHHSAVILKGVEGTGKTTLSAELISDFQHKGVPVIQLDTPLVKSSQLYAALADSLNVPKQKRDLIKALRDTKAVGQYCLVVIDQEAINSSTEVTNALKQLCLTSETTAGAVKLLVIRKDYLVIHTDTTSEADFHNWIKTEVTLNPLQTDDIEGYIHYLSAIKGLPPTPYEVGSDFLMIEQTEGRISRLKALLLPLIHKDVITRSDFIGNKHKRNTKPLNTKNSSLIIALSALIILAFGVSLNYFFLSEPSTKPTDTNKPAPTAIFANSTPTPLDKKDTQALNVTLPSTSTENSSVSTTTKKNTTSQNGITSIQDKTISSEKADTFQSDVKIKLLHLETKLTEAKIENNRLKMALLEAQKASENPLKIELPTTIDSLNTDTTGNKNRTIETASTVSDQYSTITTEPTDATLESNKQPITRVTELINRWQAAWQTQKHDAYIFTYVPGFRGPYKTHQQWLQKRYSALTTPDWIKLKRSDFTNIQLDDSIVTIDFWINYEASTGYKDKTLKRLTLKQTDGQWFISKEQNLQVKPLL